jgi:hypothetical protein
LVPVVLAGLLKRGVGRYDPELFIPLLLSSRYFAKVDALKWSIRTVNDLILTELAIRAAETQLIFSALNEEFISARAQAVEEVPCDSALFIY